jgi:hypothetical protein
MVRPSINCWTSECQVGTRDARSHPDGRERGVHGDERYINNRHCQSENAHDPQINRQVGQPVHALDVPDTVQQKKKCKQYICLSGIQHPTTTAYPINQRRRCLRKSRMLPGLCSRTMPCIRPQVKPRRQASWEHSKSSASDPKSHVHSQCGHRTISENPMERSGQGPNRTILHFSVGKKEGAVNAKDRSVDD